MEFLQRAGLVEPGWTMAMQIINFLILYGVMKHFLFVPVTNYIENRRKKIERDLSEAARKNIEAVELLSVYNSKVDGLKKEGRAIIDGSKQAADVKASAIVAEARSEADAVRIKAQRDAEDDKRRAFSEAKKQIVGIAIEAAEKIIHESVDNVKNLELIDRFIDETEEMQWGK